MPRWIPTDEVAMSASWWLILGQAWLLICVCFMLVDIATYGADPDQQQDG